MEEKIKKAIEKHLAKKGTPYPPFCAIGPSWVQMLAVFLLGLKIFPIELEETDLSTPEEFLKNGPRVCTCAWKYKISKKEGIGMFDILFA